MSRHDGLSPVRSLSDRGFELLLLTIILAATVVAQHVIRVAPIMLHFFYLPVIVAGHYFGRNVAGLTALFSVLAVAILAVLNPEGFTQGNLPVWVGVLTLCAWGGFLGLTAILFGTLSDQRYRNLLELRIAYMGIIEVLSKYLQAADHYTKSHSMRVADLSEKIAEEMDLKQSEISNIRVGALLHDIGKVEISTRLIQKAAGLTQDERAEMDTHTVRGADLVQSFGAVLKDAIPIIKHHHDHFSAASKKEGLHGEGIPVGARVVAVADAFDAIITDRPYRRGRTRHEAIAIIREGSGTQFDPAVVDAFERAIARMDDEAPTESDRPQTSRRAELVGA